MRRTPSLSELFRTALAEAMAHRGQMKQEALAKRSGVGQTSISRILRGEQDPTLEKVSALARALGYEPWMMLVQGFRPDLAPALKPVTPAEEALYERLRVAAQDLARYQAEHDP